MFAVVHVPDFSLQSSLRHEPDLSSRPVALVDPELPKPVIIQLNSKAREHGVAAGLTASQAMARCGVLLIKSRSRAREQAATEVLLQTAYAFSPAIESTAAGICTMELKGLGLESEAAAQRWALRLLEALAQCGLEAGIGFAVTPELALLATRAVPFSRAESPNPDQQKVTKVTKENSSLTSPSVQGKIACVRDAAAFVADLPMNALDAPADIAGILDRWGIRRAGEFIALGRDKVAERLGTGALELFERVSPDAARPLKLVRPPEQFVEQIEFEREIETTEPLLFVVRRFVEQLARRLDLIHFVVAELDLQLRLSSGAACARAFKIPSPTGSVETLFRMLHTWLETLRTDAPIVSARLEARPAEPETHQFGLFEATLRNPNQFAETLARLGALCGPDRAGSPVPEATHRPDAFRMRTPDFAASSTARRANSLPGLALRRFRPAIPAAIEFREQRPALIHSSVARGAVAEWRGPFISSGDWWDDRRWAREEWDVQTSDGVLYRIFRSAGGCFIEGTYD